MAAICPNKNNKLWNWTETIFKEDNAHAIYDQLGQNIPTFDQLNTLVKRYKGYELTDDNNPDVWSIENSEKLIEKWIPIPGQLARRKIFKKYSRGVAENKAKSLRDRYPDARFNVIGVQNYKEPKLNSRIQTVVPIKIVDERTIRGISNLPDNTGDVVYQNNTDQPIEDYVASEKTIRDLAERLSNRIGVNIKYFSDRTKDYKGKLESGVAYINLAHATLDTPIHEIMGHPIIRDIKNKKGNLYQNLLKELETGYGKEVLDKVKKEYVYKDAVGFDTTEIKKGEPTSTKEYSDILKYAEENNFLDGDPFSIGDFTQEKVFDVNGQTYKTVIYKDGSSSISKLPKYTLEEQQEEALVQLLGELTANKELAKEKMGNKLYSFLKQLLSQMTAYMRSLFNSKEIEINKLKADMTINDLANLLAYTNSKIVPSDSEVTYTTPDNQTFKTYQEASNHISKLFGESKDVDLSDVNINIEDLENRIAELKKEYEPVKKRHIELGKELIKYERNFLRPLTQEDKEKFAFYNELQEVNKKERNISKEFHQLQYKSIKAFIEKNKPYEQSKEIIEAWKKENNIVYNPKEVYSRGQGFYSAIGAYSTVELDLLLQNLLQHIEDNKKAGGSFDVSAFTKPIGARIGHLEKESSIRFVIYPKSEDIKWAAPTDVSSGSVWDAGEKVSKDKKSELLGVSHTKAPSLDGINEVTPNLADIIIKREHHHNELGVELTNTNFRLEYDDGVPYKIKKLVTSVNSILDSKYGKIVKPEITQQGIQPTQTKENTTSIKSVERKVRTENRNKEYTSQALINTKIAKLKEVSKKYPRSLIVSEVKKIEGDSYNSPFEEDDIPFQKVSKEQRLGANEEFVYISDASVRPRENVTDFARKFTIFKENLPIDVDVTMNTELPTVGRVDRISKKAVIHINPSLYTRDTIGHEFGHLLIDLIGGFKNPIVKQALDYLEKTKPEYVDRIRDLYYNETTDIQNHEILAQAIGVDSDYLYQQEKDKSGFRKLIDRIFRQIKALLGIEEDAVRKLTRMLFDGTREAKYSSMLRGTYEKRKTKEEVFNRERERLGKAEEGSTKLTKIQELKQQSILVLERKISLASGSEAERLTDLKSKVEALKELDSVLEFTIEATRQIHWVHKQYLDLQEAQENTDKPMWTVKQLDRWRNAVTAYDLLDDFRTLISYDNLKDVLKEKAASDSNINKVLKQLDRTVSIKNTIKQIYIDKGLELTATFLKPHVTRIQAEYEREAELEYNKLSRADKQKTSLEEYKNKIFEGKNIDRITHEAVLRELAKASRDVNSVTRLLDNVLDSPDLVVSSMAKAWAKQDFKARQRAVEVRDNIATIVRELENKYGFGVGKSQKQIYDFMLEKDEQGNYTQHILTKFNSGLFEEYKKLLQDTRKLDIKERNKQRREWLRANAPLDYQSFSKAKQDKIMTMLQEQKLTGKEVEDLSTFELYPYEARPPLEEIINAEAADELGDWVYRNIWEYRIPIKKWVNSDFSKLDAFMKKNPNDPRTKFYKYIVDLSKTADRNVPYYFRRDTKLPSIVKSGSERVREGQSLTSVVKDGFRKNFNVLADETERGNVELTNEAGEQKSFMPVYFTNNNLSEADQSYDLATVYYKYFEMANDYHFKNEILPEMEMARHFVENRKVTKTDSSGKPILNAAFGEKDKGEVRYKEGIDSNIYKQLNEWFESVVYGRRTLDEGDWNIFGLKVDQAKALDALNKYTSLNLLGFNFVQGTANVLLGETMQRIEAFSKQHLSIKSYRKGRHFYDRNLPGIMGDIGNRKPTNVVSMLLDKFDILNSYEGGVFRKDSKFRQLMQTDTVFFTAKAGEHFVQSRFMLGLLAEMEAKDIKGNVLGSMLDMVKIEDGNLVFKSKDGVPVANFNEDQQFKFEYKLRGILSKLHGEYSDLGRVAIQRHSAGRMIYMFRKFIVPGFRRRFGREIYNERLEEFTEGNYRTTSRFFKTFLTDLVKFQFDVAKEDWSKLTKVEKSNIMRTLGEAGFLTAGIILSNIFLSLRAGEDDDDWLWEFSSYQALRFRTELLFFIQPGETYKILRSPAASMSTIESLIRLTSQIITEPAEVYERGPWKDKLKLSKQVTNLVPFYKQIYRLRDVGQQVNWFIN